MYKQYKNTTCTDSLPPRNPSCSSLCIIMLSCRSNFFSWFLFWKEWKFYPTWTRMTNVHILERKLPYLWRKIWNLLSWIKNPITFTSRFVSLFPVRQWTWVYKTVTSCQMYTLVSSTNKTVRQKVNFVKQLLVVRCIL